jgi:YegS/Rv2252/BmrU family lipid kinase
MDRAVTLIVNPSAGGGRAAQRLPAVEAELRALGIDFDRAQTTALPHAEELGRAAADAGRAVFTLGGDGLVGAVAGGLVGSDAPLGVLPGGRGNDFARVLKIPKDPAEAVRALATAPVRKLDLGEVGGRPFIGVASCGFDSEANLVYLYAALRTVIAWKPARFDLVLDGEERSYTGWTVAAANSKAYGGGMYIAPDAELDDGLLDVVVSEHTSRLTFLRGLPKVFKGTHLSEPTVHVLRCRELRVSADRPFVMYADGDPIGDLPCTVTLRPGALTVLAP